MTTLLHSSGQSPAAGWSSLLGEREPRRHLVQFYDADEGLLINNVGLYLSEGLKRGEGVIVIATLAHRTAFAGRLDEMGIDLAAARENGRAVFLDARETLDRFMVAGQPDTALFESAIGAATGQLKGSGIRAYGEMVGLLWRAGDIRAAISLGELWNKLLESTGITLFCAYPVDIFASEFEMAGIDAVLCTHTHLLPTGKNGSLDSAINRALHEFFGSKLAGLKLLMQANFRPAWAVVPDAEAIILWLRRNLPGSANDILARARGYYRAAEGIATVAVEQ